MQTTTTLDGAVSPGRDAQQVAVVTGAGSGIGRACALRLADDGFAVVVNDIASERAEETHGELEKRGRPSAFHVGDVGDEAAIGVLVDLAFRTYGWCMSTSKESCMESALPCRP